MTIRPFTDNDIVTATAMSFDAWSFEMANERKAFKLLVYEYIIRFYDVNRRYSLCYEDEEGVQAFLLAGLKSDTHVCDDWLAQKLKDCSAHERQIARQYRQYLEYNGIMLKEHATTDDILLNLFVSRKTGCGGILLNALEELCFKQNIKQIYLWSDGTCNLHYYHKRGFKQVQHFHNHILLTEPLDTIIYAKKPGINLPG